LLSILPELSLGRRHLPWALVRVRENVAVRPEGADRVHGSACARGVAAITSRGAGTNATARIWNVSGRSASGRRHGGRPSIARPTRPRPDTLRPRKRAANEPSLRHRPLKTPRLRRRVVTQQKLFFPSVRRSARLPRTPRDLIPQPGTVLLPRLPSGGSQCPGSGAPLALSRHLGRSQEAGDRVPDRTPTSRASPVPRR
jgi:hypothetical protein